MNQFFLKLHVLVKSHEDFLLRLKSGLSFVQFWLYFFFRTQKYMTWLNLVDKKW